MFSTETPLADRTDTNVCLISRGAQPCPRPAFLVIARNAWMTLSAVSGAPKTVAKTQDGREDKAVILPQGPGP